MSVVPSEGAPKHAREQEGNAKDHVDGEFDARQRAEAPGCGGARQTCSVAPLQRPLRVHARRQSRLQAISARVARVQNALEEPAQVQERRARFAQHKPVWAVRQRRCVLNRTAGPATRVGRRLRAAPRSCKHKSRRAGAPAEGEGEGTLRAGDECARQECGVVRQRVDAAQARVHSKHVRQVIAHVRHEQPALLGRRKRRESERPYAPYEARPAHAPVAQLHPLVGGIRSTARHNDVLLRLRRAPELHYVARATPGAVECASRQAARAVPHAPGASRQLRTHQQRSSACSVLTT